MLKELEVLGPAKRECSGRGQLDRDWQSTVRNAANSIRKVPYYGKNIIPTVTAASFSPNYTCNFQIPVLKLSKTV